MITGMRKINKTMERIEQVITPITYIEDNEDLDGLPGAHVEVDKRYEIFTRILDMAKKSYRNGKDDASDFVDIMTDEEVDIIYDIFIKYIPPK